MTTQLPIPPSLIDAIAEVQANGWEYGTHPREKARIVLEAIRQYEAENKENHLLCTVQEVCKNNDIDKHEAKTLQSEAQNFTIVQSDIAMKQATDILSTFKTEGNRLKVDEWAAAYAALFTQMQPIFEENKRLKTQDVRLYGNDRQVPSDEPKDFAKVHVEMLDGLSNETDHFREAKEMVSSEMSVVDKKALIEKIIAVCDNTEGYALTAVTLRDLLCPYLRTTEPVSGEDRSAALKSPTQNDSPNDESMTYQESDRIAMLSEQPDEIVDINDDDPVGDAYAKGYADGYKAKALAIEEEIQQPVEKPPESYDTWKEVLDENAEYERLLTKYMDEVESLRKVKWLHEKAFNEMRDIFLLESLRCAGLNICEPALWMGICRSAMNRLSGLCLPVRESSELAKLQHEYDSTRGLWCIDRDPKEIDYEWIKQNAFQLKDNL